MRAELVEYRFNYPPLILMNNPAKLFWTKQAHLARPSDKRPMHDRDLHLVVDGLTAWAWAVTVVCFPARAKTNKNPQAQWPGWSINTPMFLRSTHMKHFRQGRASCFTTQHPLQRWLKLDKETTQVELVNGPRCYEHKCAIWIADVSRQCRGTSPTSSLNFLLKVIFFGGGEDFGGYVVIFESKLSRATLLLRFRKRGVC